jgi:hypothetical protein
MHGKHLTTFRTGPFFILVLDEMVYTEYFDAGEIVYDACSIPGTIALIQVGQACARELVAGEAILKFPFDQLFTVLNLAGNTGF